MKTQLLLPMLAALCFTGAANSQSQDQPRREPERPPGANPEARREEGRRHEAPHPEARREEGWRAEPSRPDLRHEEGRRPEPGALAPWKRRPEMCEGGPREWDRSRAPEIRRGAITDRMEERERSPGFGPMPRGPQSGPPGLEELRHQVMVLTRQVQELRAIVERERDGMKHFAERRESASRPPYLGGPGPESRESRPPLPPGGDYGRGEHHMHRDGGPHENPPPNPPGDRPPRGDREPQGNPPPPR